MPDHANAALIRKSKIGVELTDEQCATLSDVIEVAGRGELQLGVNRVLGDPGGDLPGEVVGHLPAVQADLEGGALGGGEGAEDAQAEVLGVPGRGGDGVGHVQREMLDVHGRATPTSSGDV